MSAKKKKRFIKCVVCGREVPLMFARKRRRTNEDLCVRCYGIETLITSTI